MAESAKAESSSAEVPTHPVAKFDLTQRFAPFLDLHMMMPILTWLEKQNMYPQKDLMQAKLDLCAETNMADYAIEIYKGLHGTDETPETLAEKRTWVQTRWEELKETCKPLVDLCADEAQVARLMDDDKFTAEALEESHGITEALVESLYDLAKFQMDCGMYQNVRDNLRIYLLLTTDKTSEQAMAASWGHLAACILVYDIDTATQALHTLRKHIETAEMAPLERLQQRSWLVHWALFVFFNCPDAGRLVCEFFLDDGQEDAGGGGRGRRDHREARKQFVYLNTVQVNCPWLLRYIAAAVIIEKWNRNVKKLVRAIRQEKAAYSDPVTRLMECLHLSCDLDGAQDRLAESEQVLKSDFFFNITATEDEAGAGVTAGLITNFIAGARRLIFETSCKIHQKIDLEVLSSKLKMSVEEAENWMVELIRNSNMQLENAKIDSKKHHVLIGTSHPSIYQTIREKTEGLTMRSYDLAINMSRASFN